MAGARGVQIWEDAADIGAAIAALDGTSVLVCAQKIAGGLKKLPTRCQPKRVTLLAYVNASQALGSSFDHIVMTDLHCLTPNVFCQISETLNRNGQLCLVTNSAKTSFPPHNKFMAPLVEQAGLFDWASPLWDRCCKLIRRSPCFDSAARVQTDCACVRPASPPKASAKTLEGPLAAHCKTQEQCEAVNAILKVLERGKKSVVALLAARGRGKSSALGIVAGHAKTESIRVCYTAVDKVNAEQVRRMCSTIYAKQELTYVRPTDYAALATYDLILVDEAACLPNAVLKKLVALPARTVVLSSTINGYEGTGRSFNLKLLKALGPVVTTISLNEPIRYDADDPLERLTYQLFHLVSDNATSDDPDIAEVDEKDLCVEQVDKTVLFSGDREAELHELISLFTESHYKNSPNDLLLLADAPLHEVFTCKLGGRLVGAMQVCFEGGKSSNKYHGELISSKIDEWHSSDPYWSAAPTGIRIVRIVTHANYRRHGVASKLVRELHERRTAVKAHLLGRVMDQVQWVATSFGLTPELFKFWSKCGYRMIHLSTSANDITGEHSCIMMHDDNSAPVGRLLDDFVYRTAHCTGGGSPESALPTKLLTEIMLNRVEADGFAANVAAPSLTAVETDRLRSYAAGRVNRALCRSVFGRLATWALLNKPKKKLSALECTCLVGLALQERTPDLVASEVGVQPDHVLAKFNSAVQKLVPALSTNVPGATQNTAAVAAPIELADASPAAKRAPSLSKYKNLVKKTRPAA